MTSLFGELNAVKKDIEDWRNTLPTYYEPIVVPIPDIETVENPDAFEIYPYRERLDYVTGNYSHVLLTTGFIGHTMNMYRAAILRIDRHLLGHMFPTASPSETELTYTLTYSN
jgi:hypothetical protein